MSQTSLNLEQRGFEYGVQHILSPRSASLEEILNEMLNLSTSQVDDLRHLGAIYVQGLRIQESLTLDTGNYIRVHTKPRRFPIHEINWTERVIFEHADFLVLNKPAGIPCHASVDNTQENLLSALRSLYGTEFFITHRLDVPTSGLLIVAKNKNFQKSFNQILQEKKIRKIYRALCTKKEPAIGRLRHFMIESPRAPKKLSHDPIDGQICELEILSVKKSE